MTAPRHPEARARTVEPMLGELGGGAAHDSHDSTVPGWDGRPSVDRVPLRSDEERSWDRRLAGQIEPLLETCRRLRERNLLE